jgi:hypothetical protein
LSAEAEADEEDFGFPRPSRFASHPHENNHDDMGSEELESLEKYRPHNYEFSKPKSEDINDLVDFYSNYRPHGRGRVGGGGGGYRHRSLDPDDAVVSEPRKKISDPGRPHQNFEAGGGDYEHDRQGGAYNGMRRQTAEESSNGFYDLDSIDPATRLILEKARQARSHPIENFGHAHQQEEDYSSLRPPPG